MTPSSRTPEGSPHRCDVCGKSAPVDDSTPIRDATCPYCGSLIWLASSSSMSSVRGRILARADEIVSLGKSSTSMSEVAVGTLSRIVGAVGARGGVIWSLSPSNQLNVFCSIGLAKSEPVVVTNQEHSKLVKHVFQSPAEDFTIGPGELLVEGLNNPSDMLLVCCRFSSPKMPAGMIELFQRGDTPEQARPGFLQFLRQMTNYLARSRAFAAESSETP